MAKSSPFSLAHKPVLFMKALLLSCREVLLLFSFLEQPSKNFIRRYLKMQVTLIVCNKFGKFKN